MFRGHFPAPSLPALGFLGFSSQHIPGQEMLMDDSILKINLSHLGYSQWEFGIPRKGLILEKWWGWIGWVDALVVFSKDSLIPVWNSSWDELM